MSSNHKPLPVTPLFIPVSTVTSKISDLDPLYHQALCYAYDAVPASKYMKRAHNLNVRIETHTTESVITMVRDIWRWPHTIKGLCDGVKPDCMPYCHREIGRVEAIIRNITHNGTIWPYVSYWADSMDMLCVTEHEEGEDRPDVINHGDGWHRIIANVEMGHKSIEFLFIEGGWESD